MSRSSQFADFAASVNNTPGNVSVLTANAVVAGGNVVIVSGNSMVFNTSTTTTALTITTTGQLLQNTTATPLGITAINVINAAPAGGIEFVANNSGGGNIAGLSGGGLSISTFTGAVGSESYTQRVIINSSGNLGIGTSSIISGNAVVVYGGNIFVSGGIQTTAFVGIGTQSLYNTLAIQGTSGNIYVDPTGQNINFGQNTYNNIYGGQSGNYLRFNNAPGTLLSGASGVPIAFAANGTTIGQWLSGGQFIVGITTTPPSGSASNLVVNNSSGGGIELVNNNNGGGNISALSGGGLSISTFTGSVGSEVYTQRMSVDQYGNVIIGASATQYLFGGRTTLNINGSTQSLIGFLSNGVNKGYIYTDGTSMVTTSDVGNYYIQSALNLLFYSGGTERSRITQSGQLLVGATTSPAGLASNLVVNGSVGGGIELVNNNSGGGNISALNGGGLSISTFTGAVGSETYSQRMVINSIGNVNISGNLQVSGTAYFPGSASLFGVLFTNAAETNYTIASQPSSTTNFYINNGGLQYYTSNSNTNWTLNIAFSASQSLNSVLTTGQSVTVTLMVTNSSPAYYGSAYQIDGSGVTPKWQGGTTPSSGNSNAVDVYTFLITKTANATYTVLASQTKFA